MAQDSPTGPHVVILNDFCFVQGGASRVAVDEAVALASAGVVVTFVGGVGPVCPELAAAPLRVVCLDQPDIASVRAKPQVALQGLWNAAAGRILRSVVEPLDRCNTIVHVHGYTKALSSSPVRSAVDMGFKVVLTLHDFFSACPTGAFFDFVQNEPCPLVGLSAACVATNCDKRRYSHKLYRVVRALAQRHLGHLPGRVRDYIALSNRSAELLRPYLPEDANIHFLGNPIDAVRRPRVNVAVNSALVAIGRLDAEKGIKMMVDAARRTNSPLTLVGDGPLRSYAEAYTGTRVTGWLDRADVTRELDGARCLVFSSLWYETYGLVVEEAAARGVPSIVSNITAAAERVQDGLSGWHVNSGDTDDLVRIFGTVRDDSAVGAAGIAAYERFWRDPPTLAKHAVALLDIYRQILAR